MSSEIQAVFFDMDGTFINSEPHWFAAESELMAEFEHVWTEENQQYCLGGPLPKVGKYMWELSGQKHSPDFFHHELVARTVKHFQQSIEYMPGALELLREIKAAQMPIGLVTASPRAMLDATINNLRNEEGLEFDVNICSEDVSVTKPDPEAYFLAAQRINVDISKCIVVEDSMTGITAARLSGAFVVAVPSLIAVEQSGRMKVLQTLSKIEFKDLQDMYMPQLSEESA